MKTTMAFDNPTRNRLNSFVAECRNILSEEFTSQLKRDYGLDPDSGAVTDVEKLTQLDDARRETARILRDTLQHYVAGSTSEAKKARQEAMRRIIREQAFTVLNRLCALRMAEARKLFVESVGNGLQSQGFQLYARLAGTALGESSDAYRCYLFSVFDELAVDLAVVFNRFSPEGRLFPSGTVLQDILSKLNAPEMVPLWEEDETIGWIYQYFNDPAERKKMRDESAAPRNSRELAVRNQFFTPRYVVEFLTDNTLGRIWYEMTQGQTNLKESCRYMVRRPDEVFLSEGSTEPLSSPSRSLGIPARDSAPAVTRKSPAKKSAKAAAAAAAAANAEDATGRNAHPTTVADLLLTGTEEAFPEFSAASDAQIQQMIEFAHCVDGYVRHPNEEESWQWLEELKRQHLEEMQYDGVSTQDILDALFLTCRSDRHGGDGTVYKERWFAAACNEVRRRVLNSRRTDLSQEELLKQPVFVPYRAIKDPREIRMLDPACGSMHFGLYAFDLFEVIYSEYTEFAREKAQSGDSAATAYCLLPATDYPKAIIEHNIHGIDIDRRATQIAGLSLWLRAQKSWQKQKVKPQDRPRILRSNIVCAEPMPGNSELLEEFLQKHLSSDAEGQLLTVLVRKVFESMKLAGEAGSLLKIEEEIGGEVEKARLVWDKSREKKQQSLFDNRPKQVQQEMDFVRKIDDATFWDEAENLIYAALRAYAEQAENGGGFQRRLFAEDAARGFAFIDVCRARYDVVLMNPPFGDCSEAIKPLIFAGYGRERIELGGCFISRFSMTLTSGGKLGVIANRTLLFAATLDDWRVAFLRGVEAVVDLGHGVLDALVETASFTLSAHETALTFFIGALDAQEKGAHVEQSLWSAGNGGRGLGVFRKVSEFRGIYGSPFAYWAPTSLIAKASQLRTAEAADGIARQGLATCDNFRFLRLAYELPNATEDWMPLVKGGEYQPFWADVPLRVNWRNNGQEVKSHIDAVHGQWSRVIQSTNLYGVPGATYSERTASSLSLRVLPRDCIFDKVGPFVGSEDEVRSIEIALSLIGMSYTTPYRFLIETGVGLRDGTTSGSAARHYLPSMIQRLPFPDIDPLQIHNLTRGCIQGARQLVAFEEPNAFWHEPFNWTECKSVHDLATARQTRWCSILHRTYECAEMLESLSLQLFEIGEDDRNTLELVAGRSIFSYQHRTIGDEEPLEAMLALPADQLIDLLVQAGKAHSTVYKKAYWGDRNLELIAHLWAVHPVSLIESLRKREASPKRISDTAWRVLSVAIGLVFGRISPSDFFASTEAVLPEDLFSLQAQNKSSGDGVKGSGISVCPDDSAQKSDFSRALEAVLAPFFGGNAVEQILGALEQDPTEFRRFVSQQVFTRHLSNYSDYRRQAPIYWQLSTESGGYALWIYYHRLTDQSLFHAVNNFVEPKLKQVTDQLSRLKAKSGRSSAEEKELSTLTVLESELTDFRDELLRVAKFWKPNLNDGVLITASPLWKLFRLPKWRKDLKACWDELENGDYDWAHLALSIWPDRVVRTAHKDRSIAIAHDLESDLWHEVTVTKPGKGKNAKPTTKTEWQPKKLSEAELDKIVQQVKQRPYSAS